MKESGYERFAFFAPVLLTALLEYWLLYWWYNAPVLPVINIRPGCPPPPPPAISDHFSPIPRTKESNNRLPETLLDIRFLLKKNDTCLLRNNQSSCLQPIILPLWAKIVSAWRIKTGNRRSGKSVSTMPEAAWFSHYPARSRQMYGCGVIENYHHLFVASHAGYRVYKSIHFYREFLKTEVVRYRPLIRNILKGDGGWVGRPHCWSAKTDRM